MRSLSLNHRKLFLLSISVGMASLSSCVVGPNPSAVKEVMDGRRSEANAAWWGFDENDSTQSLQAAINSGAKKLTVPNMGKDWIVGKITLASNQEILFEPGVVVTAKKGAFQGVRDAMFTAIGKENLTLRGPGATLRMQKADYQNPDLYKLGEWRHILSIRSCVNVKIIGLTLKESGGDGIYVGRSEGQDKAKSSLTYSKNINIKDVVCDNNHRQGISVITAEGLLIENCVLKNTNGTAPEAGIDLEPNGPDERFSNIVIRNCVAQGNKGAGFEVVTGSFTSDTKDISILFENCRVENSGKYGFALQCRTKDESRVGGLVEVRNCSINGSAMAGIYLKNKSVKGFLAKFVDCTLKDTANEKTSQAPIWILSQKGKEGSPVSPVPARLGGVLFENCDIHDSFKRPFCLLEDERGDTTVADVKGSINLINPSDCAMKLGSKTENCDLKIEKKNEP